MSQQTNSNKTALPVQDSAMLTNTYGFAGESRSSTTTVLGGDGAGNLDNNSPVNYNGNYTVASNFATNKVTTAGATVLNGVLNSSNGGEFYPTEAATRAEWATAGTAGSYLTGGTWTAAPTVTANNASAFVLSINNDGGKTLTVSESISGSPFTTGNGSFSEAVTFIGNANDVLTVKHNVAVANVPATTNSNTTLPALDVRNESYAENYAKAGVSSSYAWTSAHKYAEVNGNQSLNDAFAETYAYRDDKLTISSSVKTAVADAAHINGAEKIVESRAANYSYKSASGTVDYVVTDTRNLAQVDQRTWTNTTVTNVAKFEVVDTANKTTISAVGLITGTRNNLEGTKFTANTTPKFVVKGDGVGTVEVKNLTAPNGEAPNVLLSAINESSSTGSVFDSPLGAGIVPQLFNKYVNFAAKSLNGTSFDDLITVTDTEAAPINVTIDAKAGNDTIVGGFGADTITGGAGADVLTGGRGADTFVISDSLDTILDFDATADAIIRDPSILTTNPNFIPTVKIAVKDGVLDLFSITEDGGKAVGIGFEITGSDKGDLIKGGKQADKIFAGEGADTVSGGGGVDKIDLTEKTQVQDVLDFSSRNNVVNFKQSTMFDFKSPFTPDLAKDGDVVTGFVSGTDKIQFNAANFGKVAGVLIPAGGTAYAAGNNLTSDDFVTVKIGDAASTLAANTAGKGRFIFDSASKVLFLDVNGDTTVTASAFSGQADDLAVIRLTGATDTLAATDFIFA